MAGLILLGVLSIAAGWGYTGGCLHCHTRLGELACDLFGLGGVVGLHFLSTDGGGVLFQQSSLALDWFACSSGLALVNNHRDVVSDARRPANIADRYWPALTVAVFAVLMLLPFALLPLIGRSLPHGQVWPALIALPLALAVIWRFAREPRGPVFNRILVQTVQVEFAFSLLLSTGLLM